VQRTSTGAAPDAPAVPKASCTTQACSAEGRVFTVTPYPAPLATGVAKLKVPSAATGRSSPALFCSTRSGLARPVTFTLTVYAVFAHTTAMSLTSASPTVPAPRSTLQVCVGLAGCCFTVTA
jgi:hypothetical protein